MNLKKLAKMLDMREQKERQRFGLTTFFTKNLIKIEKWCWA